MIYKGQSIREPRQNFWKNKGQLCLREFIAFARKNFRKIRDIYLPSFGKNKGQGLYKKYWEYTMTELLFWCEQSFVINLTGPLYMFPRFRLLPAKPALSWDSRTFVIVRIGSAESSGRIASYKLEHCNGIKLAKMMLQNWLACPWTRLGISHHILLTC